MAVRGGSGRFADSSSLTSVETMPSPKTEVRQGLLYRWTEYSADFFERMTAGMDFLDYHLV